MKQDEIGIFEEVKTPGRVRDGGSPDEAWEVCRDQIMQILEATLWDLYR